MYEGEDLPDDFASLFGRKLSDDDDSEDDFDFAAWVKGDLTEEDRQDNLSRHEAISATKAQLVMAIEAKTAKPPSQPPSQPQKSIISNNRSENTDPKDRKGLSNPARSTETNRDEEATLEAYRHAAVAKKLKSNIKMGVEPGMGRVVYATVDFKPRDIVIEDEPLASVPWDSCEESDFAAACLKCINDWAAQQTCSSRELWQIFTAQKIASTCCVLLSSSCAVRTEWLTWYYVPDSRLSTPEGIRFLDLAERLSELPGFLPNPISGHDIVLALDVLRIHGYQFLTTNLALFSVGTLVAHSCSPNVVQKTTTGRLVHRATRPIKAGEMITFSYFTAADMRKPTMFRRERLFEQKDFWCQCKRCLGPDMTRPLPCLLCDGHLHHILSPEEAIGESPTTLCMLPAKTPGWSCIYGAHAGWNCDTCDFSSSTSDECESANFAVEVDVLLNNKAMEGMLNLSSVSPAEVSILLSKIEAKLGLQHWSYNMILEKSTASLFRYSMENHDEHATLEAFRHAISFNRWLRAMFLHEPLSYANESVHLLNPLFYFMEQRGEEVPGWLSAAAVELLHDCLSAIAIEWGEDDGNVQHLRRLKLGHCGSCGKPASPMSTEWKDAAFCNSECQSRHVERLDVLSVGA
jgi:hypothetical protein